MLIINSTHYKLISVFLLIGLLFSKSGQCQVVYITPSGSGTMNGTSWANALAGNSPGISGYTRLADTLRHAINGKVFRIERGFKMAKVIK